MLYYLLELQLKTTFDFCADIALKTENVTYRFVTVIDR